MRRITVAAVLVAAGLAVAAPAAGAATCTDKQDALTFYFPAHVHAGKAFDLEIETRAVLAEQLTGVSVEVNGVAVPFTPRYGITTVRVQAPDRLGRFSITARWEQPEDATDYGTPACSGVDDLTATAVPRRTRIGDTYEPHVAGRFRVVLTPLNFNEKASVTTNRVTANCDIGACSSFRLRSGALAWRTEDGVNYRAVRSLDRPTGSCTVTRRNIVTGETWTRTVRNAFLVRIVGTLRTTKWLTRANGLLFATRLEGYVRQELTATGTARAAGCTSSKQRSRLTMTAP